MFGISSRYVIFFKSMNIHLSILLTGNHLSTILQKKIELIFTGPKVKRIDIITWPDKAVIILVCLRSQMPWMEKCLKCNGVT